MTTPTRRQAYIIVHFQDGDTTPIRLDSFTSHTITLKQLHKTLTASNNLSSVINPVTHLTGMVR